MSKVHVMNHPLILHKLTLMRDCQTGIKEFREATREISMLMCYEATRDLPLKTVQIETPLAHASARVISLVKSLHLCQFFVQVLAWLMVCLSLSLMLK